MKVSDLIASALRLVGALAHGETPNAEELADSFAVLNMLVDGWNAQGIIYTLAPSSFVVQANVSRYAIGPGAAWPSAARPVLIRAASVKNAAGISAPVEVADAKKFAAIVDKSETAQLPRMLYCDYAYPVSWIEVWPKPAGLLTLDLYSFLPLAQFASVNDAIELPPGYLRGLRHNLARELAAEFGFALPADVKEIATESKAALVQLSAQTLSGDTPTQPAA